MSSPSKTIVPLVAGSVPASTARKVDLPAPFGPIRPVIFPGRTSSDTPSTARIPSKCRWMSVATSMGWSGAAVIVSSFEIRTALEDPARLGPHAFGPEPEEPDDEQADRDPLHGRDQVWRRHPAADGRGYQPRRLEETHGHEQRPEDRAQVVAAPADDDRGEKDDRLGVEPL